MKFISKKTIPCRKILLNIFAYLFLLSNIYADENLEKVPWDINKLKAPPQTYPADEFNTNGVKALFYKGLDWKGKPSRVFAYVGIPKHQPNEKLPGVVLVHGGGGTAFHEWVALWNNRGYAAIAMDTCGCIPDANGKPQRHQSGGPPGWGGFDQIDEPIQDQWTYHAVADIILAHSLLRSFADVDPDRIGITGISWGGYLVCIVAGIDDRFKFAVPVYGCGFLGENSVWIEVFKKMGKEKSEKWLSLWDPSKYLPNAKMPFLWVTGSNDFAYPMDSLQKSYRLTKGERFLSVKIKMPHGHGGPGEKPEEIKIFADSILKNGVPLPSIYQQGKDWIKFKSQTKIIKAEFNYTTDANKKWQEREWTTIPAAIESDIVRAEIPTNTVVYYFNITDERGIVVSSEHIEIKNH
ncbi:MAG: alpha/beta hydrolase family protein [Verrucomicrobiia bacterium]|jgi:dienelactone hydrolase